jgi:CHAT domain-containing protein
MLAPSYARSGSSFKDSVANPWDTWTECRCPFGEAFLKAGRVDEAIARNLDAVRIVESLRGLVRGEEERLTFFSQRTGPYYSLVESLVTARDVPFSKFDRQTGRRNESAGEAAFEYADAARARLLNERLAIRRTVEGEGELPSKIWLEERNLMRRVHADLRDGKRLEESSGYREFEKFVERVRQRYPDYAELRYPIPVAARDVPVNQGEAVIAFALLQRQVAIWVVQQGQAPRTVVVPVGRDHIVGRVGDLLASMRPDGEGWLPAFNKQASRDLYSWLLEEPLRAVLPGTKLVVIPDTDLAKIPLEILSSSEGEFVGDRYTVVYSPSASVLRHQRRSKEKARKGEQTNSALLVGDPVFDADDGRGAVLAGRGDLSTRSAALRKYSSDRGFGMFRRLRWSEREVREAAAALEALGTSTDVLLDVAASEYKIKQLDLGAYRYIHFATHGILAADVPYLRQPALVLSQSPDLRGEDGFLSMSEVLGLRLHAEVTVLSACQTGLGKEVPGEGVVGLARAFLYAGSRWVVASLWQVEDESTAILMADFYKNMVHGHGVTDAMRLAKQRLRSSPGGRWQHPFYWAPFVVFGPE